MKAHTPGPWHLNTLETVLYSVHANRGCVAEVSRGTMNEVSADEIEANARLIAAAPDLLAACELLFSEMGTRISPAAFAEFSEVAKNKLGRAINKAKAQ